MGEYAKAAWNAERKQLSRRIRMQRQEIRWLHVWANACNSTFYASCVTQNELRQKLADAETEIAALSECLASKQATP